MEGGEKKAEINEWRERELCKCVERSVVYIRCVYKVLRKVVCLVSCINSSLVNKYSSVSLQPHYTMGTLQHSKTLNNTQQQPSMLNINVNKQVNPKKPSRIKP